MTSDELLLLQAEMKAIRDLLGSHEDTYQKVKALRDALKDVTEHFAAVMSGPLVAGAGIRFVNGVEAIPTIAAARDALKLAGVTAHE